MLPTPDTSHVSFKTIYEPAEDSYLLLDTLSSDAEVEFLRHRFRLQTPFVLEVGTGSGVVIAFLTAQAEHIFGKPIISAGIDVNLNACVATRHTAQKAVKEQASASEYIASVNGDLCSSLRPGCVDVLVFNPPYVPSEELPPLPNTTRTYRDTFERESHLLALSYDGGKDGMETTERLLTALPDVLSPDGVAYILLCAQNKPEKVKQEIRHLPNGPWHAESVGSSGKKAGWEKLQIVRVFRNDMQQEG